MLHTCVVCVPQKRQSNLWQWHNFLSQKIHFSLSIKSTLMWILWELQVWFCLPCIYHHHYFMSNNFVFFILAIFCCTFWNFSSFWGNWFCLWFLALLYFLHLMPPQLEHNGCCMVLLSVKCQLYANQSEQTCPCVSVLWVNRTLEQPDVSHDTLTHT